MENWLTERVRRVPRRQMIVGMACGGAVLGIAGMAALRRFLPYVGFDSAAMALRSRVRPHIEKADAESLTGIDPSLRGLEAFFDEAKGHADDFADDVLGFYSKYKLIRGQHERYLRDKFSEHFFAPDELKQAMTSAVESYVAELEAIDNRMLVDIRLDVADIPAAQPLARMPVPELQSRFRKICAKIEGITGADLAVDVGKAIADVIVTSVVALVVARLGTSATVLGVGAASGAWSLGIGLVISVIVDQIIGAVWNWTYDPHGKLMKMMKNKLEEIRSTVFDGDAGQPGLREELRRYAEKRALVRREAVLQLFADTKGST